MVTLNITVSVTSNNVSHVTIPEPFDRATGKIRTKFAQMSENGLTEIIKYFETLGIHFLTFWYSSNIKK